MLDLSKLRYRVTCVADGVQLDLTPISTGLGISEGAKELAAKIQLKVSAQAEFNGKSVSELLKPFVTIVVFADMGDGYVEVCRGKIQKLSVTETNRDFYLDVEAADDAGELRKTQADFYFTADHTSTAILDEVFKNTDFKSRSISQISSIPKKFIVENIWQISSTTCSKTFARPARAITLFVRQAVKLKFLNAAIIRHVGASTRPKMCRK